MTACQCCGAEIDESGALDLNLGLPPGTDGFERLADGKVLLSGDVAFVRCVLPVELTGDLELWFEVRGLAEGTEFRTRLEVVPEGRGRSVQVEGTDRSTGPVTPIRRTLELRNLDPGNYTVKVTVTAGANALTRQRLITVVRDGN